MSPRDAFGVAIRIVGLLIVLAGLLYVIDAALLMIDPEYFNKYKSGVPTAPMSHYLGTGIAGILVGLYLLRGARMIQRLAYGEIPKAP
jgi:hypothetical protein